MNIKQKATSRELTYYQNDRKSIEMVFRHVRCNDCFNPFWNELIAQQDICLMASGRTLFRPELVYDFFKNHGFAGYFDKQRLTSWEQVVYFIEDRRDYYRHRDIPNGYRRRCLD